MPHCVIKFLEKTKTKKFDKTLLGKPKHPKGGQWTKPHPMVSWQKTENLRPGPATSIWKVRQKCPSRVSQKRLENFNKDKGESSLLKMSPPLPRYPWVSGARFVTPEPRISDLVLNHHSLEELELKKHPKAALLIKFVLKAFLVLVLLKIDGRALNH